METTEAIAQGLTLRQRAITAYNQAERECGLIQQKDTARQLEKAKAAFVECVAHFLVRHLDEKGTPLFAQENTIVDRGVGLNGRTFFVCPVVRHGIIVARDSAYTQSNEWLSVDFGSCPDCGYRRFSSLFTTMRLTGLGAVLANNPFHVCPADTEHWLIDSPKRREIEARQAAVVLAKPMITLHPDSPQARLLAAIEGMIAVGSPIGGE